MCVTQCVSGSAIWQGEKCLINIAVQCTLENISYVISIDGIMFLFLVSSAVWVLDGGNPAGFDCNFIFSVYC